MQPYVRVSYSIYLWHNQTIHNLCRPRGMTGEAQRPVGFERERSDSFCWMRVAGVERTIGSIGGPIVGVDTVCEARTRAWPGGKTS